MGKPIDGKEPKGMIAIMIVLRQYVQEFQRLCDEVGYENLDNTQKQLYDKAKDFPVK